MPKTRRQRAEPTNDWEQLQLLSRFPEQLTYELIRPVVLFGHSSAERARETGVPQRTLYRQAARFEAQGVASLFTSVPDRHQRLPGESREAIRMLKAEYPAFRANELATIFHIRFGHRPSPHTVKRVLTEVPLTPVRQRRFPPYHQISQPALDRLAIIRLHSEGWNKRSVAGYLEISRQTVHGTLRRWVYEGVWRLDDKSHACTGGIRKVDPQTMLLVRDLQENPELGEFRIHAALKQLGIDLSPRTCGRILALNRTLYRLPTLTRSSRELRPTPFKARHRHQYWTVDIRYLDHQLDDGKVCCVSILENYSRAILASALSRKQGLTTYLLVLNAAIRQHGVPEALVSEHGGVFRAQQTLTIYDALVITKLEIDRRQAWQSYIETTFNVQRRMAGWHVAHAATWSELLARHDQRVVGFNYQVHWGHREWQDGRHSPGEVLGWVSGRACSIEELQRPFTATRFGRTLNQAGYLRFRHWRLYAERGLASDAVAVWLSGESLTVAFADEPLAHYAVTFQPDQRRLANVTEQQLFETSYRSPQLPLWEVRPADSLTVIRLLPYARRRASESARTCQLPLRLPTQEHAAHG